MSLGIPRPPWAKIAEGLNWAHPTYPLSISRGQREVRRLPKFPGSF